MHKDREESLGSCVKNAYNKELSRFHGFIIRSAVKGIVYILPYRETFLDSVMGDEKTDDENAYELMNELISNSKVLTDYLVKFLKDKGLFELD